LSRALRLNGNGITERQTLVRACDRRKPIDRSTAHRLRQEAERLLLDSSKLAAALAGDEEAAFYLRLCNKGDPSGLGLAALAAYWSGTPLPAYQELLQAGWSDNWLGMKIELGVHFASVMRRLFRAGRFPHHLEGKIAIYRGACDTDARTAAKGVSWTTNRDVACWFAYRYRREQPIVLHAHVDASEVVYYEDDRYEQEVILRRVVPALVDALPFTWEKGRHRYADLHGLE
jgi:hypothetical protein